MKVYQIYYDESQIDQLEPGYSPYFNKRCNVFFESQCIRDLVESGAHKGHDYFGAVSYKLRNKIAFIKDNWKNNENIANRSTTEFTPELFRQELYKHNPDVMSFQRHAGHDPILVAEQFHPGFRAYWEKIMKAIGYRWEPVHLNDVIYCNYFVAKSELYEAFVKEMLAPAMDFMLGMEELWRHCPYPNPWPHHLKKDIGINYYSFHPFLCERMISFYIHVHKLKCLHY